MFAPAKTPAARVERIQKEMTVILKAPDMADRIANEGSLAVGNTAAEFAQMITAEAGKWHALIRQAGIRAE